MIIIIGAGLSGLLTAYRLKKAGIPFRILEARDRIGGRMHTVNTLPKTPVELGATWFGSPHKNLLALLEELGIAFFEQYMEGTSFYQPLSSAPAEAIQIPRQPPNFRIAGGSSHLINSLYNTLDPEDVLLNQTAKQIKIMAHTVHVLTHEVFEADKVVLAIPPKLWANRISFKPELPKDIVQIASSTHTWMEDSIKVALTYSHPFWLDQKLSGTLFSNLGPVTEFYDHCDQQRLKFALCGFINPAYKQLSDKERRAHVLQQLKSVFGEQAETFTDYQECIWSQEAHTFEASVQGHVPHENNGHPIFRTNLFKGRLLLSSTETASVFPGYMEGAVFSGNATATKIIDAF